MHWKLSLQQQVYSNENPAPMLASQGHPAFGQDKNLNVLNWLIMRMFIASSLLDYICMCKVLTLLFGLEAVVAGILI